MFCRKRRGWGDWKSLRVSGLVCAAVSRTHDLGNWSPRVLSWWEALYKGRGLDKDKIEPLNIVDGGNLAPPRAPKLLQFLGPPGLTRPQHLNPKALRVYIGFRVYGLECLYLSS